MLLMARILEERRRAHSCVHAREITPVVQGPKRREFVSKENKIKEN